MRRFLFATLIVVGQSLPASAGPWTRAKGHGYSRVALAAEDHAGLAATRADVYLEYGLATGWTVSAKLNDVRFEAAADSYDDRSWRIGLRRSVLNWAGVVGTIEGGLVKEASTLVGQACNRPGAEVRAALGWSGRIAERDGYMFAEVAGQSQAACRGQRAELGVGQNIAEDFWLVNQVWIARGSHGQWSDKVQTELMWRRPWGDLAIGYQREISGRFEEASILLSLARTF